MSTFQLQRSGPQAPFGLLVTGSKSKRGQGIFVSGTVPGTPAANLGLDLTEGWMILSIDHHDLRSATTPDVHAAIANAGDSLTLVMEKNQAGFEANRKRSAALLMKRATISAASAEDETPLPQQPMVATQTPVAPDVSVVTGTEDDEEPTFSWKSSPAPRLQTPPAPPVPPADKESRPDAATLILKKSSPAASFGIDLLFSPQFGVYVHGAVPGSPAAAVPALAEGLQVIALQGHDTVEATAADVQQILQACGTSLEIVVARNPDGYAACVASQPQSRDIRAASVSVPPEANATDFLVTLRRHNGAFGLVLIGAQDSTFDGVYVSAVQPHSAAAAHETLVDRLHQHLQVLAINGTDMRRATLTEALDVVQASSDNLTLLLGANKDFFVRANFGNKEVKPDTSAASPGTVEWGVQLRPASARPERPVRPAVARPSFVAVAPPVAVATATAVASNSPAKGKGDSAAPVRDVSMQRHGGDSLGIKIRGGTEMGPGVGIFVSHVEAGSLAGRAGVRMGDMIISVNGISFAGSTHQRAVAVLSQAATIAFKLQYCGKIPRQKGAVDEAVSWEYLAEGSFH